MADKKWNGRTGGGKLGQKSLHFFFRYFDVRIAYIPLFVVVLFYMVFAHKRCLAIFHYMRRRQGFGVCKSWWKTYLNHLYFGQALLDKFAVFSGGAPKYNVIVDGKEAFDEAMHGSDGFLVASAHVGNFELAGYLLSKPEKCMYGVIFGGEAQEVLEYRTSVLGDNNIKLIPVKSDMSHIFAIHDALKSGSVVCMTTDRVFVGNKNIAVSFMGDEALFPAGMFYMAHSQNVKILTCFVVRQKCMHYVARVRVLDVNAADYHVRGQYERALLEAYVRELELVLKQYPEQWYNYYEFWEN